MKPIFKIAPLCVLLLSGCANQSGGGYSNTSSQAAVGAAIGCVGGAVAMKLLGNGQNAFAGCAAGAVAGGLIAYEKARQAEIDAAQRAAIEMRSQGVNTDIQTVTANVTDRATGEAKQVSQLSTITYKLTPAQHGSNAELDAAIAAGKMAAFANGKVSVTNGSPQVFTAISKGYQSVARNSQVAYATDHSGNSSSFNPKKGTEIIVSRPVEQMI